MDTRKFNTSKSSIVISFREEQGRTMHAAFYDHYAIRKITHQNTLSTISPAISEDKIKEKIETFTSFIHDNNTKPTLGINGEKTKKVVPQITTDASTQGGLLIIPGQRKYPKPGEHYDERRMHETTLIKDALMHGQPILAICGGAWKLWSAFGGGIVPVEGHVSPSMPTITDEGDIGNNPQVHDIELIDNTILKACMNVNHATVNSVHWAAPAPNAHALMMIQISALSQESKNSDAVIQPTPNTIEAFETKYGVPVVGIQWHPEAYYKNQYENEIEKAQSENHLRIIKYMAKSGDAYKAKKQMLQEFKAKFSLSAKSISLGIFANNFSLFKRIENVHLEENRHNDPNMQREYDRRFGLILYQNTNQP